MLRALDVLFLIALAVFVVVMVAMITSANGHGINLTWR